MHTRKRRVQVSIKDISEKCKGFRRYEDRSDTDELFEVVFVNEDTAVWVAALSGIMGEAVKPAGKKPSREENDSTKAFGGILQGQTLFRHDGPGGAIIAMLWPWQDRIHTTLKAFPVKK
jgi:hypothetical protein